MSFHTQSGIHGLLNGSSLRWDLTGILEDKTPTSAVRNQLRNLFEVVNGFHKKARQLPFTGFSLICSLSSLSLSLSLSEIRCCTPQKKGRMVQLARSIVAHVR